MIMIFLVFYPVIKITSQWHFKLFYKNKNEYCNYAVRVFIIQASVGKF